MRSTPLSEVASALRGATEIEILPDGIAALRLPAWTRAQQADRWIEFWAAHTLGVRLVTVTSATRLRIVTSVTRMIAVGETAPQFEARFVATVAGLEVARADVTDGPLIVTQADRTWIDVDGPRLTLDFDLGATDAPREVTLWLPHNARSVIHSVGSDEPLLPAPTPTRPRWVHHGSSISHSLEAESPLTTWPQLAATALDLELTNLAIAGNAQLDPFVARTIASLQADIITLKLGVNVINANSMNVRTFVPALHGFLDLVREGHPSTPIVLITSVASPAIEDTPGPTLKVEGRWYGSPRELPPGDYTLTLSRTRSLIRAAVAARTDPLLFLGEGLELFGLDDADLLWDGLHPNQAGYSLLASRFVAQARDPSTGIGAAFGRLTS